MTGLAVREPNDIRFTAVLACLLGEDRTTPRIEQLCVKNIHGLAQVAGLGGDELGYLLGRVASLKGPP